MLLSELVAASRDVASNASRLAKVARIAELLRRLAPDEVPIALRWLVGSLRQGRIGVAGALLRDALAATPAAAASSLALADVDAAFELLARATEAERDFLARLLFGELRQGALEGVLLDAVARASGVAPADLRRAAMLAGD